MTNIEIARMNYIGRWINLGKSADVAGMTFPVGV